jgi:hypothetical protein
MQKGAMIAPGAGHSGKSMKPAYATIKGFEVIRMIRKRQCILLEPGVTGEVRFVSKLFDWAIAPRGLRLLCAMQRNLVHRTLFMECARRGKLLQERDYVNTSSRVSLSSV